MLAPRRRSLVRPPLPRRTRRLGCWPAWAILMMGLLALLNRLNLSWEALLAPLLPQSSDLAALAQAAYGRADLDATIVLGQARLRSDPMDVETLSLVVRALIYRSYADVGQEADRAAALELTSYALSRSSFGQAIPALHALALHANQRPDQANRLALRAIETERQNIPARLALALSYSARGLFETALREADKALALAEEAHQQRRSDWRVDALRARAIVLGDLGRYAEAIQTIDQAIALQSRLAALHFERALYALQLGDRDSATAAYFRVIASHPNNAKARLRLCVLSSELGERQAALRYCQEAVQRRHDWYEGWYQLGREYYLGGNFAAARDAFASCARLQVAQGVPLRQRNMACWTLQGQSAEAIGDCDGLLSAYREFKAMRTIADLPQAWNYPPEGPLICQTPTP
ncbi:MAG: tetratricopeptide repeat protein [Anaerolineae bacterium]|nr:tetratricopeptide repeat protein [Anaerolineae bacterium]MDW8173900.1 tetratricopeptide repeat protein [Anaerolineae bacterium]